MPARSAALLLAALFVCGLLAGCSGSSGPSSGATAAILASIKISPGTSVLAVGGHEQLSATGTYSDGSTSNISGLVSWQSSSASVTVDANGTATATASGSSTVTASLNGVSGSASINVAVPAVVSLSVQPTSASINAGTNQQFTAFATYSDGSERDVTALANWNSSNAAVANVSGGLATGISTGQSSITVVMGSVVGGATLTVNPASLVDISVNSDYDQIPIGATAQFTATGIFSDGSSQTLASAQWNSSDATISSIDSNGVATGVAQGVVTITATSGSISSTATLTVLPAVLLSLAITPANSSIALGTGQQFTAVGTFSDGSTQSLPAVTWSATPSNVASISATGFGNGVGVGPATVTATAGSITGSTSLTVTAATLVSIAVNPPAPTIPIGVTQQFSAVGTFSDSSTQDITSAVTWTSSVGSVATINASGLAFSLANGTSTIRAASGGVSGSATLTVAPVSLVSINVLPSNTTVAAPSLVQFSAVGVFSNGSTQPLTGVSWRSSSARIANIRSNGLARAKHTGSATITAKLGSISGSTTLTVSNASLVSIAVTPANPSVAPGSTQRFTAIGTYSDSHTQDLTIQAHWSSSSGSVATVSNSLGSDGLATTIAPGITTIGASTAGISGSTTLVVTP